MLEWAELVTTTVPRYSERGVACCGCGLEAWLSGGGAAVCFGPWADTVRWRMEKFNLVMM